MANRLDNIDQYETEAMLLGMWYDPVDHTYNHATPSGTDVFCAETIRFLLNTASHDTAGEALGALYEREHNVVEGVYGFKPNHSQASP